MATVSNLIVQMQSGNKSAVASWTWSKSNTDKYEVIWEYYSGAKDKKGNTIWTAASTSNVTAKSSRYTFPTDAKQVRVKVKPIAKKKTSKKYYWTASYSAYKYLTVVECPAKVKASTFALEKTENGQIRAHLVVSVAASAKKFAYQIFENNSAVSMSSRMTINLTTDMYITNYQFKTGCSYRVRIATYGADESTLGWGELSNAVSSGASDCTITECKMAINSNNQKCIYLAWNYNGSETPSNAWSYEVEYTKTKDYIADKYKDALSTEGVTKVTVSATTSAPPKYVYIPLDASQAGSIYYFRVRANNGTSGGLKYSPWWSELAECSFGTTPTAPTTWSTVGSYRITDMITLYFTHNSQDKSDMKQYKVTIKNGTDTFTIEGSPDPTAEDKNSWYIIMNPTEMGFEDGDTVTWKVMTKGAYDEWSPYSIERQFTVYAPPGISLTMSSQLSEEDEDPEASNILHHFPFDVNTSVESGVRQYMIGLTFEVIANNTYETVDVNGVSKRVSQGDTIFSKTYALNSVQSVDDSFTAGDMILENSESYTFRSSAAFDSGLSAEASIQVTVDFTAEDLPEPDTSGINITEDLCATFDVYCRDDSDHIYSDVLLSVYRINFDGSLTEVQKDMSPDDGDTVTVIDYHPQLDYAKYRLVAKSTTTGQMTFNDVVSDFIGETAAVLQWDEVYNDYLTVNNEDIEVEDDTAHKWVGSLLKLPWNISTSESSEIDKNLVEYIGRSHPVSYYGTQVGQKLSLKTEIERKDTDTLDLLRRLQIYRGDVYVREPSGIGYWANVSVTFERSYSNYVMPITVEAVRVEGGA